MILTLISSLVPIIGNVLDEVVEDKDEAARLKHRITSKLIDQQSELVRQSGEIIKAEASSSNWLASSWRPITMLSFVAIIVNNYIIAPYAAWFGSPVPVLDIPEGMWSLLTVGIGGYIAGRSLEKAGGFEGVGKVAGKVTGGFRSVRK